MPLEAIILACTGLWLVFPKGFKFMVATWVGTAGGIFLWSIGMGIAFLEGHKPSWEVMGWSVLASIIVGIVIGCVLAARG